MPGRREVAHAVLAMALAGQACAARHRPEAAPEPDAVEGRVGFEFVPDPGGPRPERSEHQVFVSPIPLETHLPDYPQEALARGAPPVTVVVRIIVEESGAVGQVLASPLDQPAEGIDRAPFRAAVEQAVRKWDFVPARIRTFEGRDADGDGRADYDVLVDTRPIRIYLDLRFTFEVVGGKGRVQIRPDP